jgi:hypothetical protein
MAADPMPIMTPETKAPWWRLPFRATLIAFLAIAAFFLVTEHSAHLYGVLPLLFLLACPLMHFMHHGHRGHGGHGDSGHNKITSGDRDA